MGKGGGTDWHSSKVPKIEVRKIETKQPIITNQEIIQEHNTKESSMFSSRVPRTYQLDKQLTPGPGQYKTQSSFSTPFPRYNIVNYFTPRRVQKHSSIGPGSYESDLQMCYATRTNYKAPFNSTARRFKKQSNNPIKDLAFKKQTKDNDKKEVKQKHLNKVKEIYKDLLNNQ